MIITKINELGRSMIEMLGVLAIIAVLSVGGIAGYSKAMEKFKINKTIEEYGYLLQSLIEHLDEYKKANMTFLEMAILVKSLNLVPESYEVSNIWSGLIDSNNNFISIGFYNFNNARYLQFSVKIGGISKNNDNKAVTAGFSKGVCLSLFNDLARPLQSEIYRARVYLDNRVNISFYGAKYCGGELKCLQTTTLSEIEQACGSCDKNNSACDVSIDF